MSESEVQVTLVKCRLMKKLKKSQLIKKGIGILLNVSLYEIHECKL